MRLCVIGGSGRMGRRICALAEKNTTFTKVLCCGRQEDKRALFSQADVAIDFSLPSALDETLALAEEAGLPLVVGITGLSDAQIRALSSYALKIPLFYATNFSPGIHAFLQAASLLSSKLAEFSFTIDEVHHLRKKDAPSGTALTLEQSLQRKADIHSQRRGAVIGEHTLTITSEHERIVLFHEAFSRDLFAQGALRAALFLVTKPPGLYSMQDL